LQDWIVEMVKGDRDARLEASAYPLIVFVHVPKTAGSTIKQVLNLCTPRANGWAELIIGNCVSFPGLARKLDWVGGHLGRDQFANALIWCDRPLEYFASVREPVSQLVSVLNWSFEKYSRGDYYARYSLDEQRLDAEVMSTDFNNPAAILNLLFRCPGLLNIQSRLVPGVDFAALSDDEVARRLATYTFVATEADLLRLYRAFGFAQLPDGVDKIRENVAKPHFDRRVFDSPRFKEFLSIHHKHDLRLYSAVCGASWPVEARHSFRPSLVERQLCTFETFDELSYLVCNPCQAGCSRHLFLHIFDAPPSAPTVCASQRMRVTPLFRALRADRARITSELRLVG
jgi:hypothetical protein